MLYVAKGSALGAQDGAWKYISAPLEIQKEDKAEAISRADKILATFQLTAVRDKYPHTISGGMHQRVASPDLPFWAHKLSLR